MIRVFNHFIPTTLVALFLAEALVLAASVTTGAAIRFHNEPSLLAAPSVSLGWPTLTFSLVMLAIMASFGLYSSELPKGFGAMAVRLLVSFLVGLLVLSIVFYLVPEFHLGRGVFALAWLIAFAATVAMRIVFLRYLARLEFGRRILVLGTGTAASCLDRPQDNPHGGRYRIVGFMPVFDSEHHVSAGRILPATESISAVVSRYGVDEVVIAVSDRRGGKLPLEELLECKLRGIEITELSSFFERERGQLQIDSIRASWMVFGGGFRQNRPHEVIKTAFDLTASVCLLVLAFPLMLLTAALIRLEDGGPVLYRQTRVGKGGKLFEIFKFRSMRCDAEKDGQACWAAVRDERVTRIGRVLRLLHVDELPQVINVLRGEMSFVGPRPERPSFVAELTRQIPYYAVRHSIKPGITGWAQVRYHYSDSTGTAAEKLQYDLYYVKNHSLFLDVMIVIETVGVVFFGKGAR